MSDSDILALQQHLYLAASHVEATVARWLLDAREGRRQTQDHELEAMRELLTVSIQQRERLASAVMGARACAPEAATHG